MDREGVRALEQVEENLVDRVEILFEQSPLRHGTPIVGLPVLS